MQVVTLHLIVAASADLKRRSANPASHTCSEASTVTTRANAIAPESSSGASSRTQQVAATACDPEGKEVVVVLIQTPDNLADAAAAAVLAADFADAVCATWQSELSRRLVDDSDDMPLLRISHLLAPALRSIGATSSGFKNFTVEHTVVSLPSCFTEGDSTFCP